MDVPNTNWVIANVVGVGIYILMFLIYDRILGYRMRASQYFVVCLIYAVIALVDFYVYHKSSQIEERKTIEQQLRDMCGTFGISILILIIFGAFHIYERKKTAAQLSRILQDSFKKKK
tara:strand:- start:1044 stop:1397 length:354 start_codon:yes stop_codon:yes gene_type:complete